MKPHWLWLADRWHAGFFPVCECDGSWYYLFVMRLGKLFIKAEWEGK